MEQIKEQHLLNRKECNIIRGFAIMAVISNNFGHLIDSTIQDNEFVYDFSQVDAFLNLLAHPTSVSFFDLLSFYSPFGVMLFIFLSGYGLSLKYEKITTEVVPYKVFFSSHYMKLFRMQLKGLSLFLLVMFIFNKDFIVYFRHLLGQLLLLENLNPIDPIILAGPYWFFGMIMEIYIVYRLIIYKRPTPLILFIIFLSLIVMSVCDPNGEIIKYLRINLFMAIFPFCLGVLFSRFEDTLIFTYNNLSKCLLWLFLSFVLLTICKLNFYTWLLMPAFIIFFSIPLAKLIYKNNLLSDIFNWFGVLSGIIFVVHPIVREILIQRTNISGSYYGMFLVYLFLTISLSVILKPIFNNKK